MGRRDNKKSEHEEWKLKDHNALDESNAGSFFVYACIRASLYFLESEIDVLTTT